MLQVDPGGVGEGHRVILEAQERYLPAETQHSKTKQNHEIQDFTQYIPLHMSTHTCSCTCAHTHTIPCRNSNATVARIEKVKVVLAFAPLVFLREFCSVHYSKRVIDGGVVAHRSWTQCRETVLNTENKEKPNTSAYVGFSLFSAFNYSFTALHPAPVCNDFSNAEEKHPWSLEEGVVECERSRAD